MSEVHARACGEREVGKEPSVASVVALARDCGNVVRLDSSIGAKEAHVCDPAHIQQNRHSCQAPRNEKPPVVSRGPEGIQGQGVCCCALCSAFWGKIAVVTAQPPRQHTDSRHVNLHIHTRYHDGLTQATKPNTSWAEI